MKKKNWKRIRSEAEDEEKRETQREKEGPAEKGGMVGGSTTDTIQAYYYDNNIAIRMGYYRKLQTQN